MHEVGGCSDNAWKNNIKNTWASSLFVSPPPTLADVPIQVTDSAFTIAVTVAAAG